MVFSTKWACLLGRHPTRPGSRGGTREFAGAGNYQHRQYQGNIEAKPGRTKTTFLSGLLHDLGKLALAYLAPEKYTTALRIVKEEKISLCEAEKSQFGATHGKVGGYIAGLWGMHLSVVEAIAFHHHPDMLRSQGFSSLMAVYVANALEHEAVPNGSEAPNPAIDMAFIEKNGKAAGSGLEKLQLFRESHSACPRGIRNLEKPWLARKRERTPKCPAPLYNLQELELYENA
jgi:hypothetical protein